MCAVNVFIYNSIGSTQLYFLAHTSRESKQVEQALGEKMLPRLCLVHVIAASFIRAPQQLACARPCQVIHRSGSGWRLPGRLFCISTAAYSPSGLHSILNPSKKIMSTPPSPSGWAESSSYTLDLFDPVGCNHLRKTRDLCRGRGFFFFFREDLSRDLYRLTYLPPQINADWWWDG